MSKYSFDIEGIYIFKFHDNTVLGARVKGFNSEKEIVTLHYSVFDRDSNGSVPKTVEYPLSLFSNWYKPEKGITH